MGNAANRGLMVKLTTGWPPPAYICLQPVEVLSKDHQLVLVMLFDKSQISVDRVLRSLSELPIHRAERRRLFREIQSGRDILPLTTNHTDESLCFALLTEIANAAPAQ
jgi:hypothetical protein